MHSDITEKALFIVKPVAETNLGNAAGLKKKKVSYLHRCWTQFR